jgi:hypothetical protein
MVGFWKAMPTRIARAATSRPPTMTTPLVGCTSPLTRRRMVDLPHPDGPTSATNSPSAIRMVVLDKAGTARSPRPKVTEASDSSMAVAVTGGPSNWALGCMRITAKVHASWMPAAAPRKIKGFAEWRPKRRDSI